MSSLIETFDSTLPMEELGACLTKHKCVNILNSGPASQKILEQQLLIVNGWNHVAQLHVCNGDSKLPLIKAISGCVQLVHNVMELHAPPEEAFNQQWLVTNDYIITTAHMELC